MSPHVLKEKPSSMMVISAGASAVTPAGPHSQRQAQDSWAKGLVLIARLPELRASQGHGLHGFHGSNRLREWQQLPERRVELLWLNNKNNKGQFRQVDVRCCPLRG